MHEKQCRSRSAGFIRSQLIWIYTVFKRGYGFFCKTYVDSAIIRLNTVIIIMLIDLTQGLNFQIYDKASVISKIFYDYPRCQSFKWT